MATRVGLNPRTATYALAILLLALLTFSLLIRRDGGIRRRAWGVRVPISAPSGSPPNGCLFLVLREHFGEVRPAADFSTRFEDWRFSLFFHSPTAYGGQPQRPPRWITAVLRRDRGSSAVLELGDDFVGLALTQAQAQELAVRLRPAIQAFHQRCLNQPDAQWNATCTTVPIGEPCPIPEWHVPPH